MQRTPARVILFLQTLLLLMSCGTADQQMQPSDTAEPSRLVFDHKTPRDSVDWSSLNQAGQTPETKETDLEWPGERLGLIGPIVATGGTGSNQFIIVFDPAGIPVGTLTRKTYKKDPMQLAKLLAKAQVRSEIQNLSTLVYLMGSQKGAGRSRLASP